MKTISFLFRSILVLASFGPLHSARGSDPSSQAEQWRAEHRLIDLHQHIDYTAERLQRAVKIMDAAGLGVGVNLSGGTVTQGKDGAASEFERNKSLADQLYPGRFVHYMNLDYSRWNHPDFADEAAKQIEEGYRLGAAGFKEYKRLGLYLRDKDGKLIKIDDPKLDPVWKKCGELGMPVSIHVADPRAFWLPYNDKNERWKELKDHRSWWFGNPSIYPPREELLAALDRVIERHPNTTFVSVHFANNAEDLDWVEQALDRHPNMYADLAARIPEIGRHDPAKVRRLFIKHQDRIFFATDFQIYDILTLGSGGSGPPPTDADAIEFYKKHWRWLETDDKNFAHMTPIQGGWTISGIGLPPEVLRKIYFDNARKLLARSLPFPVLKIPHIDKDFDLDGDLSQEAWNKAQPAYVEADTVKGTAHPELSTPVRVLWSDQYLYLRYDSPYTALTVFSPAQPDKERIGLWDKDVVELFIVPNPARLDQYTEYEVAPNGETIDLIIDGPKKDFVWSSKWTCAVRQNEQTKVWRAAMRIPLASISASKPQIGQRWRINLYRIDRAGKVFLAWSPTLNGSYHTPSRFGYVEFAP